MADQLILIAVSFFTATLSGLLGVGGGALLLAILAIYFPPAVLIPIHAIVQLASNLSRAWLSRDEIAWQWVKPFGVGTVLGTVVGSQIFVSLPRKVLELMLALTVLTLVWIPLPKRFDRVAGKTLGVGALNGLVSTLVGANGILLAPFLAREPFGKVKLIATFAASQTIVHATKVVAFLLLGFVIGPHIPLLGGMIVASFAGSYFAKHFHERMPEKPFRAVFKIGVTALALRMLARALTEGD